MPRVKTEVGREWWRKKWERVQWHKWALECYTQIKRGGFAVFAGSERWPVVASGNWLYKMRAFGSARFPSEPVGRFCGKYLILHKKLAPKWLKKWALYQNDVLILDDLDRGTLAAYLMERKLREAT